MSRCTSCREDYTVLIGGLCTTCRLWAAMQNDDESQPTTPPTPSLPHRDTPLFGGFASELEREECEEYGRCEGDPHGETSTGTSHTRT